MLAYFLVLAFGFAAGSFVNVCIYRTPKDMSVAVPRSHCTSCGRTLRAYDLIPVLSYLMIGGKCRYCGVRLSPRYVIVELLTGVLFVLIFHRYGFTFDFVMYAYLMILLVAVVFIDLKHMIIPNGIVIAGIYGGLAVFVYNIFRPMEIYGDTNWWTPLLGIIPGSVFLFIVFLIGIIIYKTDSAMGLGDVKLFAPIGLFLGWRLCILALLISVIAGGLIGVILIATGVKKRKDTIPFGPFIVLGSFVTLLWGWDIIYWYVY